MQEKKPSSNTGKSILVELERLNENVEELYDLVDRAQKKSRRPQLMSGMMNGLTSAIGIVIATVIMAAVLIYFGQAFIRSDAFQEWIGNAIQKAVEDSVKNAWDSAF